jgi:hypothetical protein
MCRHPRKRPVVFRIDVYADTCSFQIRSVYRCIEISQGFRGRLGTSEGFFYGLDTLPLFIAIGIYVLFWPGRFIPTTPATDLEPKSSQETAPTHSTVDKVES